MRDTGRHRRVPAHERDFRQFTGAFDRPIAPAPSFAESLRRQVAQPSTEVAGERQPPALVPISTIPDLPLRSGHRTRRIGFSILEIAAAMLLISTLALSAYVINTVGRPAGTGDGTVDRDLPGQLAQGVASPALSAPANTGGRAVNWGGDPGRTQYYGEAAVASESAPLEVPIGDAETTTVGPGLIVDDSWYGWTVRDSGDAFLRVNVETGQQIWSRPYRTWGTIASDGQRIFAFLIDASETPTPVPVAIDMQTGEIAWRGPAMHPFATSIALDPESTTSVPESTPVAGAVAVEAVPGEPEHAYFSMVDEEQGPVVVGDTVYFTDSTATTVALNTADGAERWRDDRSANVAGYADGIWTLTAGTIVANESYLFAMLPDNSIAGLDPATGQEVSRSRQGGFGDSNRIILGMALRGDRLVVLTVSTFLSEDEPGLGLAAVSVLDASTLDVLVTSDFVEGAAADEMMVTETSAIVLTLSEQEVMELVEVDLATGSLSEPFGTGRFVGSVRLSGSGETLIAAMSSGTVLVFSMETHEVVDRYGIQRGQPIALVGGPVPVIDGQPVVIWKGGSNDSVPQAPMATPIP